MDPNAVTHRRQGYGETKGKHYQIKAEKYKNQMNEKTKNDEGKNKVAAKAKTKFNKKAKPRGSHREVLIEVSYQSHTPMWRYATLPVFEINVKKILFHNLGIFFKRDFILIAFCQEYPQMLCAIFCTHRSNGL